MKAPDSKKLKSIAIKYHINTLYLFGSQATGKANKLSDTDFAVILDKKVNEKDYSDYQLKITSELMRFADTERTDVVIMNHPKVPLLLKYNIIKDGKVLVERKKDRRVNFEFVIIRDWLDWEFHEKLWGDIYVREVAAGRL